MTLGGFKKSLDIGKQYLVRLLLSRMFMNDAGGEARAERVAESLVEGYVDHGFCIDADEARQIGLQVEELPSDQVRMVWKICKLNRQKEEMEARERQKEVADMLKNLPPDLLKSLPQSRNEQQQLSARLSMKCKTKMHIPQIDTDVDPWDVAIRIATAILKQRGEVSMSEIKAMPFLTDDDDVHDMVSYLLRYPNAELHQRKVASYPIPRWEQFIRISFPEKV